MTTEQLYDSFTDIDSRYLTETMEAPPKKTRSIWFKVACSAALILVLISCFSLFRKTQHGFYLCQQNGQFFLTTGQDSEPNPNIPNNLHCENFIGVFFDSVEEMRRDFLTCNFTETECEDIVLLLRRNGWKVEAPDLLNLCKPILPDDVTSARVCWHGEPEYSIDLSCDTLQACLYAFSKDRFEYARDKLLYYTPGSSSVLTEKTPIKDRNATFYRVQSGGYAYSFLVYTLTDGDKTIYVKETFWDSDSDLSSDIDMYIQDDGFYSYVRIRGYTTRPTVEWLLSFGLERCP